VWFVVHLYCNTWLLQKVQICTQGLLWCHKNRQISNSVASSKKLELENLDAITCSYKIVLCQACKFYHSWRQLWSHDTVVLLLVTCQKGKLLCLLWSFLLYWTFCLLWGHFHAKNEMEASSENNNRKFTYSV
jgi:hypothetical protein